MTLKIGDRVGAISHTEDGVAFMFGWGVYSGDEVPPAGVKFMGMELAKLGKKNPKITLDDGKVVWGCECWWGPEEKVKKQIDGFRVVTVNIEDSRAAANPPAAEAAGPNDDDEEEEYLDDEDEPEEVDDGDILDASYEKKSDEPGFAPRSTD